jgi:protein translocase SEC61 complex gamma subunit
LSRSVRNLTEKVSSSKHEIQHFRAKSTKSLEYQKIAFATAIGFAIMGFIGFFVKLIHIPINNIIVGGG